MDAMLYLPPQVAESIAHYLVKATPLPDRLAPDLHIALFSHKFIDKTS
jgi:hypothetical protein